MSQNVFIQINESDILSGSGQNKRSAHPSDATSSFYAPDFFLQDTTPWILPESISTIKFSQFTDKLSECSATHLKWENLDSSSFETSFQKAKQLINDKILKKIVPVCFQTGYANEESNLCEYFLSKIPKSPVKNLFLYGATFDDSGIIGLTPEILFEIKDNTLFTSALAGTAPQSLKSTLLENAKDLEEHKLVIEDIKGKLTSFGEVKIGQTIIHDVGVMAHLKTPIRVSLNRIVSFEEAVRVLHPTAALGSFPSNPHSWNFFHNEDKICPRDRFGAPFGIRHSNGEGFCLVAIRGIQWKKSDCTIGAGAGIVDGSEFKQELREILLKQSSVRDIFNV